MLEEEIGDFLGCSASSDQIRRKNEKTQQENDCPEEKIPKFHLCGGSEETRREDERREAAFVAKDKNKKREGKG
jgi:hypothetical protein